MYQVLCIVLIILSTPLFATEDAQQRKRYLQAKEALQKGNYTEFKALREQLNHYPLVAYLDYYQMLNNIEKITLNQAIHFIQHSPSKPLANRFERSYLTHLAKQKNWQAFLAFYPKEPHSRDLRCVHFLAKWHTGSREQALQGAKKLWLSGQSQPESCDPLFNVWYQAGQRSNQDIWQRIQLTFQANQYQLMRYLVGLLDNTWKSWGDLLLEVYIQPQNMQDHKRYASQHRLMRDIIELGLMKLSSKDPQQAWELLQHYQQSHDLSKQQIANIHRKLALQLTSTRETTLRDWLDGFIEQNQQNKLLSERIRLAVWERKWPEVLHWIQYLKPQNAQQDIWQYWKARALAATGKASVAQEIYQSLAKTQNYYGFWAAQRLGKNYQISFTSIQPKISWQQAVNKWPALQRITELKELQEDHLARSEWYDLLKNETQEHQLQLGRLVLEKKWHNLAIYASIQADARHALAIRFPLHLHQTFFKFAQQHPFVDTSLLYAISRQESALNHQAISPAGARGLMQLLPSTAKYTAKKIGLRYRGVKQLYDPNINLQLGSAYLQRLLKHYDGNRILASAAYNAGMGRVANWLSEIKHLDSDIWVENIPFRETRRYVKNILAFSLIYQYQLNQPLQFLAEAELVVLNEDS